MFGVCIVLEMLVVHCLGIDIDTERYITSRASEDSKISLMMDLGTIEINDGDKTIN